MAYVELALGRVEDDVFAGKWKQMRGQAKEWWGKLTDDDLEKVGGKRDKLIGLLQSATDTPVRKQKRKSIIAWRSGRMRGGPKALPA